MSKQIILSSEEKIVCPQCQHGFELHEGITRQTIEQYEQDFENALKERATELEQETERRLKRTFDAQIEDLETQLTESKHTLTEAKKQAETIRQEAKTKALEEFETERQSLQQELSEKNDKLRDLREQELLLRKEKSKLEESRQEMELEFQRKVDKEKRDIEEQVRATEAERFKLKESEYQKKIEDAQKANEELRRKLDQGSQQLQGEVQEQELEGLLRVNFPFDAIEPVPKGEFGGDVLQRVISPNGQPSGTILWESKRTKSWSEGWLAKLRDDQRAAKAEIAILVSQSLPKGMETFNEVDGIWITSHRLLIPVATVLRRSLLEVTSARQIAEGQQTKTEIVYQYLTGPRFKQRVEAIVEAFSAMQEDLEKERKVIQKQWAKREEQINRVIGATVGMYGDLQGIAGKSLQEIQGLEFAALESETDAAKQLPKP